MAISSFEAAKKVCELSNWTITNLKLQKILYILHLSYLGEKDELLVRDDFEAWHYGPVLPSLYDKLKIFSNRPITNIFYNTTVEEETREISFIKENYKEIASKSAWDLVLMTHLKGGAWEKHYDCAGKGIKIPSEDIKKEYEDFYARP